MSTTIYMSTKDGEVACEAHGARYGGPLGEWLPIEAWERDDWYRESGEMMECETCLKDGVRARTIRAQIGTDAWLAVSAREPRHDDGALIFRYGPRSAAHRLIEVRLTPLDVYEVTVHYMPVRGRDAFRVREVARHTEVYADELAALVRRINNEV